MALGVLAVVSLAPLLLEPRPVAFVPPYESAAAQWGSQAIVGVLMGVAIWSRARVDRREESHAGGWLLAFAFVAALMTAWHWYAVDNWYLDPPSAEYVDTWQRQLYLGVLSVRQQNQAGESLAPHVYRVLPYGFTRSLEWLTGDWRFSCLAYRWFFTFWLVWASYRFCRGFLGRSRALVATAVVPLLYPASVLYYLGQLTDPMSHALFVLAMIYVVENRWRELVPTLALGILAKETVVILVAAYAACHWRDRPASLRRSLALGIAGAAAVVASRLVVGWSSLLTSINGTAALMITSNLGLGDPPYHGMAPMYLNYVQPLVFIGSFVPLIALKWRRTPRVLRALFSTLTPLVLVSSLCFSWLHEGRNYVPLLPLLITMAMPPLVPRPASGAAPDEEAGQRRSDVPAPA